MHIYSFQLSQTGIILTVYTLPGTHYIYNRLALLSAFLPDMYDTFNDLVFEQ